MGNAAGFYIMGTNNGTPANQGAGIISNFRYVNGTAVYTAQGNGGQFSLQQVTSTGGVNALISGHIMFELV